jgi:hypothetical protein
VRISLPKSERVNIEKIGDRLAEAADQLDRASASGLSTQEIDLDKIRTATASKASARRAVARALQFTKTQVDAALALPPSERRSALLRLVNEATQSRHRALQQGASSFDDPDWASASASESWLHALVLVEDRQMDEATSARVAQIIDRLLAG